MCNDELKLLLASAIEETEEDREEERKATATFVSADPDDYDDEGNYEDEDEDEDEDEEWYYIDSNEYNTICNGKDMANKYIQRITELLALQREQQPLLSINDFSELMQALQDLRHETYPTRNLTCDYHVR